MRRNQVMLFCLGFLSLLFYFLSEIRIKKILITTLYFIIVASVYLLIRKNILSHSPHGLTAIADNLLMGAHSIGERFATAPAKAR